MKKHAYLIIAHHQLRQLKILMKLLDDERNDIYLHIDKKSKILDRNNLETCLVKSKLFLVDSLDIVWGDYSQVKCEMRLLGQAVKGDYAYYHLISGVDLPLKTQDEIHAFFDENPEVEYIQFNDFEIKDEYVERIKYYHFFQRLAGRKMGFWYYLDRVSIKIQKFLKISRLKKSDWQIQKGTNWFSITDHMAKYVVSKEHWVKKYCSYSRCADELFLQTISFNSPYRKNIVSPNFINDHYSCLRKIDWKRGNPYTFRKCDYEELIQSPHMFARKFDDSVDGEIINILKEYLEGKMNK